MHRVLVTLLLTSRVPTHFASLACRQEPFIAVLGASWCWHSMSEQHIVVYPIGKNLQDFVFKKMTDHTVIVVYSIPVKRPKLKALQGQQSSAVYLGVFINC